MAGTHCCIREADGDTHLADATRSCPLAILCAGPSTGALPRSSAASTGSCFSILSSLTLHTFPDPHLHPSYPRLRVGATDPQTTLAAQWWI